MPRSSLDLLKFASDRVQCNSIINMKLVFALVVCYTTLTYGYPQFSQPSGYPTSDEGDSELESAQPSSGFNVSPTTLEGSNASDIDSEDSVEDEEGSESQFPGASPIAGSSESKVIRRSAEDEFNSTAVAGEETESAGLHPTIPGSETKISRRSAEDEFNSTATDGEEVDSAGLHPTILGSDTKISRRSAGDEFNTTSTDDEAVESAAFHPAIVGSDTKISRRSAEDEFNSTATDGEEVDSAGLHPTILGSDTKISRRSAGDEFNTTSTDDEQVESAAFHPISVGSNPRITRRSAEDSFNLTATPEELESVGIHPSSVGSSPRITRRSAEDSFNLTATPEELESVGIHPSSVGSAPRFSRSADDEFNATLSDDDTLKSDGLHPTIVGSETKFSRRSADEELASGSSSVDNSPTFSSSGSLAATDSGSAIGGESPFAFGVNAQPGSSSAASQTPSQGVGSPTNIRKFVRRSADDFDSDSTSDFSSTDASPSVVDSVQSGIVAGSVQPSDAYPSSGSSDAAGVPPVVVPLSNVRQLVRRSQDDYEEDSGASFSDSFSDGGAVDEEYDDQASSGDGQFGAVPISDPQQPPAFGSDGSSQFGGSPDYSAGSFPAGVETVGSSGNSPDFTGPSSGSFSSSPSFAQPPSAFNPSPSGGFAASGPGAQSSFASRQGAALDDEAVTDVPAVGAEYDDEETKFH